MTETDAILTAAQLTERIGAASTLDELTELRGVLVEHDGPIVAGEFFEACKLYGKRRRELEGEQARREVADATAEELLASDGSECADPGVAQLDACEVGREVTQPDWPGWQQPCPQVATQHLRANGGCYPICDGHMADLAANDQLATPGAVA